MAAPSSNPYQHLFTQLPSGQGYFSIAGLKDARIQQVSRAESEASDYSLLSCPVAEERDREGACITAQLMRELCLALLVLPVSFPTPLRFCWRVL
jgi:hypothetical protein